MNQSQAPSSGSRQIAGMPAFIVVWIGQIISILATQMTQFAITIWAYEKTGSVTALGLVAVFGSVPFLLISPVAGAMIDRYNRKLMMALSDLGAGMATILLLVLQAAGALEVWHLYLTAAITGLFASFQWPAYSASISLMVTKEQLGRANGLMSLLEAGPGVLAPLMAGALLPLVGFAGILTIDVVTFVVAIAALMVVFVPQPTRTAVDAAAKGNLLAEGLYGFRYIFARPSLLGLQLVFFVGNIFGGMFWTLLAPMILARTGNSEWALGSVQSAGAIGGIVGGLLLTAWGGFKRRVHGVLVGHIALGLLGNVPMMLMGLPVWLAASFVASFIIPTLNGSNQAIWQSKVAPDLQGRVFSARRLIAWVTNPITPILAGVLADNWLEPIFRKGDGVAQFWVNIVGIGPGAGMALLMGICGLATALVGGLAYLFPAVRNAEDRLPDYGGEPVNS